MRRMVPLLSIPIVLATAMAAGQPTFRDITRRAGIDFTHDMGLSGQKMMVETMGSGGGFVDLDNDGDLDLYLVNGAPLPGYHGPRPLRDAFYLNDGSASFTRVPGNSFERDKAYGMGLCAGDYDNDGFTDLYLTNFGPDVLLHNAGDGSLTPVTA